VLFAAVHGGARGIAADGDATAEIQARIDAAFLAGGDSAAYDNMFANDTVDLWLWGQTPREGDFAGVLRYYARWVAIPDACFAGLFPPVSTF